MSPPQGIVSGEDASLITAQDAAQWSNLRTTGWESDLTSCPDRRKARCTRRGRHESPSDRAIGRALSLGYAAGAKGKVKVINVKADASAPAVAPSEATVKSGQYSIARPLYLITTDSPSATVKAFVDFALSEPGQRIVREQEYISIQ